MEAYISERSRKVLIQTSKSGDVSSNETPYAVIVNLKNKTVSSVGSLVSLYCNSPYANWRKLTSHEPALSAAINLVSTKNSGK